MEKTHNFIRKEARHPLEVAVRIADESPRRKLELTFTENISLRGARVLSSRKWRTDDRLELALTAIEISPDESRADSPRAARVCYCESLRDAGFAIGIEFLESASPWFQSLETGLTVDLGAIKKG